MRKQTDLAKVKQTALALLSTEINETPYSPMIVKHPFTDTGVSAIPDGKGGVEMIDLKEDDAQFKWRQAMARQIDKADNAYAIYMMVTKPYALTFLKFAMPHLSREDMSQILASAWTRSEAPHQDVNVTVNQLLRMFKQADPTCLMEQDEYIQFKTLDETVTVYRGVTPHNAKSVKALSWSLNQETAEWFAHRFGENGTVYEAQIDKKHIYAYFSGRNESEVIVDPSYKAKAEKYAKIISKTIILSGMDAASFGQNAYFYDAAEGLLTATILLVAEFCEPEKRHIVSVFKIIQELLAPSQKKGKNQFQQLMEMLPDDHKAKWFAGAALNTAEQSMASVMSTALSRLNSFLDSELEQLLCFDTEIDAEKFCNEKSAIFVVMPEENPNTFFMISLIIQQLYREILAVADEHGGKLKNRCVFFCDEFGTLPKIESAEMMFSASRSRRLQIVPIIQSFSQLDKNYGKEGAEIIVDNTQLTIFGGFAPNSSSAEVLSKALGSRTVMSGSVSRSRNDPSESLQMIERPLLTPDELKSLPKGQFVVMKTGVHPMRVNRSL